MEKKTSNLEKILRDASFSNTKHKDLLRGRLFDEKQELELDDLALVAGGAGRSLLHDESEKTDEIMGWKPFGTNLGKPV